MRLSTAHRDCPLKSLNVHASRSSQGLPFTDIAGEKLRFHSRTRPSVYGGIPT